MRRTIEGNERRGGGSPSGTYVSNGELKLGSGNYSYDKEHQVTMTAEGAGHPTALSISLFSAIKGRKPSHLPFGVSIIPVAYLPEVMRMNVPL